MGSFKLCGLLFVVGLTQSAPQVNQQGVVSRVMGQLQPTIARTVAQLLGGAGSQTQTLGFGTANVGSSFGQGSSRFTGGSSSFGQGSSSNFGQETSSFSGGSRGVSSGLSASQLTSQVVTSLQPSIAAAVAEALRGRTTSTSVSSTISAEEQERINALQSANAQYNFEYKVGDNDKQTYISQTESRNGEAVQGAYSYVDPAGALITVNYEAGPMGYTESRDVQEGYVQIDPKNIPQPWTGPLAGVSSASTGASSGSVSSGRSQSDLIAQILRAIQPQITSAVQTAIGSRNRASSGSLNAVNFQSNARRGFNSEANLVSSVIGALQPQISGAVQSALSRTRTAAVSRPVAQPVASSGVNDIFGGSGVKIQTPEFNIEY